MRVVCPGCPYQLHTVLELGFTATQIGEPKTELLVDLTFCTLNKVHRAWAVDHLGP